MLKVAIVLCLTVVLMGCAATIPASPSISPAPSVFPVKISGMDVGVQTAIRLQKTPRRYLVTGQVPPGMAVVNKSGYLWLSGVPRKVGTYSFVVVVKG